MTFTTLGLDPSKTSFGWATIGRWRNADPPADQVAESEAERRPSWGTWCFTGLEDGQLWDAAQQKIARLVMDVGPDLVCYERAHHRGGAATVQGIGFGVLIELVCERLRIPYIRVATSTLKKWATGHGRAEKEHMVACANARLRVRLQPEDHDSADALLIAAYAEEFRRTKM